MTFIRAYLWNAGSLLLILKRTFKLFSYSKAIIKVVRGGGSTRSSDEFSVMEMERRG